MARGGYFHGDEYIEYKDGNLAPSRSSPSYAKKTVYNSGTYNKSKNYHKSSYSRSVNSSNYKHNWSCAPKYDKNYYERNKHRFNNVNRNKSKNNQGYRKKSRNNGSTSSFACIIGLLIWFGCTAYGTSFNHFGNVGPGMIGSFIGIFLGLMVVVLLDG